MNAWEDAAPLLLLGLVLCTVIAVGYTVLWPVTADVYSVLMGLGT